MLFPVMVDTKLREGSMSSRFFVREQSTQIICTRHTPSAYDIYIKISIMLWLQCGMLSPCHCKTILIPRLHVLVNPHQHGHFLSTTLQ